MFSQHGNIVAVIGASLLVFPKLVLGAAARVHAEMSGHSTGAQPPPRST
ncbi:hypothetical protein [Nocardia stercoris]|nr:hypothetical protein [Nocardia stercoris]